MAPSNNEMKQTKPAMARMARSSLLISVFDGPQGGWRYGSSIRVNWYQIVAAMARLASAWAHPSETRIARRSMSKPTSVSGGHAIQSANRTAANSGEGSNGRQAPSVIAYGTQKSAARPAWYHRQSATRRRLVGGMATGSLNNAPSCAGPWDAFDGVTVVA